LAPDFSRGTGLVKKYRNHIMFMLSAID